MIQDRRTWRNHALAASVCVLLLTSVGFGQEPNKDSSSAPSSWDASSETPTPDQTKADKKEAPEPPGGRVFGVMPNYRAIDQSQVSGPLTVSQKFAISRRDSFDYPLALVTAGLATMGQLSNQHPSFGREAGGFSKRYATTFADQAIGNFMTVSIFPTILHQDPRYYRRGTGSTWSRMSYALSRMFVTPTDSGKRQFNYSEWVGNATATALSNIYYPDGRTVASNLQGLGMQIGLDEFDNVLKEFWPDIKQKLFARHHTANSGH